MSMSSDIFIYCSNAPSSIKVEGAACENLPSKLNFFPFFGQLKYASIDDTSLPKGEVKVEVFVEGDIY